MERKHYLDNIRGIVILLVIFYHVIYIYNHIGIITNIVVEGIPQMDVVLYFLYPWFMCLLFVIAGISARISLQKRTGKEFIKERATRLLVPSIAGIFLIGWIGGYITNQYADMFAGNGAMIPGFVKYFIYCFAGIGPLWFCHELFAGCLLLLLIRFLDKKDRLWQLGGKANIVVLLLLVFPLWGSSMILNTPLIEVYRNGIYWFCILLGYFIFSHDEVMERLEKICVPLILLAVLAGVAYTVYYFGVNNTTHDVLDSFWTNAYAWLMILAILGCGKKWLDKETKFTAYIRKRNFGFYVLHYTLLISIAYLLDKYAHLPKIGNYVSVAVLTAVLLPLLYEVVVRIPVVRFLLLGEKKQKNILH